MNTSTHLFECDDKAVNPQHYKTKNGIEAIDAIEAFTDGLNGIEAVDTGNALKYLCRWKRKNGIQDLRKAIWYITHLVRHLEQQTEEAEWNREEKHE